MNMSDLTLASREAGLMWTGNGNGSKNREADYYMQPQCSGVGLEDDSGQANSVKKRKRNLPGNPDPDAEVIALSPRTLMATNRFVCEVCNKGFQRDQNLQLHKRGHNLPWKLRQRTSMDIKKRVYICPEPSCVHHNASRALGDLTGIKKHFCRKHGEKKWKCERCPKRYAVQSDWKAHSKTCGTREYRCDCGIIFSRRDSFITHRAFCCALAEDNARLHFTGSNTNHIIMPPNQNPSSSNKSSTLLNSTSYFNPSTVIPLIEQHAFRQSAQLSQHQQNRAGLNSNYLSSFENTVIPSDLHFNLKKHVYPPSGFNATTLTHAPQQKHEQLSELGNLIARPCNEEQSSMFTLDTMQQQSIAAAAGPRTSISTSTFGSTSASTSATARTFPALDFHHKVSPMGATFPSQKGMSLSNTVPNLFDHSNVKLPLNTSLDAATSTTHGMPSRMNPNAYLREPPCLLRNLQVAHSDSDEATAILSGYGGMLLNQHSYRGMSNNNNSMRGMGVFQPSFSNSSFLSSIARKEEVLTRDFLHSGRATHGIGLLSTVPQREEMISLGQFPNMSAAAASITDNDNKAAVVMREGRHEEEEEEEEEEPYEGISNGFAEHPSMHNHCTSFSSGRPWLG